MSVIIVLAVTVATYRQHIALRTLNSQLAVATWQAVAVPLYMALPCLATCRTQSRGSSALTLKMQAGFVSLKPAKYSMVWHALRACLSKKTLGTMYHVLCVVAYPHCLPLLVWGPNTIARLARAPQNRSCSGVQVPTSCNLPARGHA